MRFYQRSETLAGDILQTRSSAEPTIPRQPEPPARVNLLENRINTALNRKGIDTPINSEGAAVVQTIIGRPVSESTPLADLSAVEQDYVLQDYNRNRPPHPQARATTETREQVDPVTGLVVPRPATSRGPRATLSLPNFAAIAKPESPQFHLSRLRLDANCSFRARAGDPSGQGNRKHDCQSSSGNLEVCWACR